MIINSNKIFALVALIMCLFLPHAHAQNFRAHADLAPVPASGFYRILLSPELTSCLDPGLSDLRIKGDNAFVPYILRQGTRQVNSGYFKTFPIVSIATDSDKTTVIFASSIGNTIGQFSLVTKNTAVQRNATLSGSNEQKHWFILDDHILLTGSSNSADTFTQTIDFPLSSYKYFKLIVNNGHTDPIDIVGAGVFNTSSISDLVYYIEDPGSTFVQKDSTDKISYIFIQNAVPTFIDSISFLVSGPAFYKRDGLLQANMVGGDGAPTYLSRSLNVVSGTPIYCAGINAKGRSLLLTINNGDAPPLKILAVHIYQKQKGLVVYLEKNKHYAMMAGDTSLTPAIYDLQNFNDSIPAMLPTAQIGALIFETQQKTTKNSNNYWIWAMIILAVVVLAGLTYKLINDMNRL